ncbi:unnamed protein product [Closterium sp. NIES-64]|nr:unnamed protein product [Closterium sp. NIES-64]
MTWRQRTLSTGCRLTKPFCLILRLPSTTITCRHSFSRRVGGIRGPPADPPSAPPPCKLPRRPPDLSSRLAAVLQNINPPRPAPSPWRNPPSLPKPGLPSAATPAAPAATASISVAQSFPMPGSSTAAAAAIPPAAAAAAVAAPAVASSAVAAAAVAVAVASAVSCIQPPAYGYDQGAQWTTSSSDNNAISRIRLSTAHSNPQSTAAESAEPSVASRAFLPVPHVAAFGPERPLRVDASGTLPRPMCGAKEGMLKQQLMALAEAMAVDDSVHPCVIYSRRGHLIHAPFPFPCIPLFLPSRPPGLPPASPVPTLPHQVRWRQFMRQVRREAAAGGDTLQRIAFHALEALQARMDGTALTRWRTPLNITLQVLTFPPPHLPHSPPSPLPTFPTPHLPLSLPLPPPGNDSMAVLGHGNEHGVPAFMHLANIAAVHEVVRAFTHQPQQHTHAHAQSRGHPHAPHPASLPQPAPLPPVASHSAGQSVRRRRLHIIAVGFYGGPHWINILMRLAAHFSTLPLLPATANAAPAAAASAAATPAAVAPVAGSNSSTSSGSTSGSSGSTHPAPHTPNPPTPPSQTTHTSSPTNAAPPPRPTVHVRITAVDFGIIRVEEYPTGLVHLGGQYLEQVASMLGLSLTFHGIETTPHDFHPSQVEVDEGEEVVVLANWGLMVFPDDTVLRSNPRNSILKWIRDLRPLLLLQVDIDLDANGPFFLSRFHAAFANFAAFVESFDATMPHSATPRFVAESILARDFMNGIACEGMNRWLRAERLEKWVHRMGTMGLEPVPIGPDTVAAGREITEGKDGRFRLEVHGESGALQLSWRGVPMIFIAAWR